MARNSSGNYTLPAGNPVVTGTSIDTSWANGTMNDIANALTDSLDRTGKGGMLAPLPFVDGSVVAPAVSFTTEPGSGLYRAGSSDVRIAVIGTDSVTFKPGKLGVGVVPANTFDVSSAGATTVTVQGGAASTVLLGMGDAADPDAGAIAYDNTTNRMGIRVGGLADAITIDGLNVSFAGDLTVVGISDLATVDISGGAIDGTVIGGSTAAAGSFTTINASGLTAVEELKVESSADPEITLTDTGTWDASIRVDGANGALVFENAKNTERMRIDSSGNVGIGEPPLATGNSATNKTLYIANTDTAALSLDSTATGRRYTLLSWTDGSLNVRDEDDLSFRFSILANGNITTGGSSGARWCAGNGSPEGVVTARRGSFYSRFDGGAGTCFYVKESGDGNTGWVAK